MGGTDLIGSSTGASVIANAWTGNLDRQLAGGTENVASLSLHRRIESCDDSCEQALCQNVALMVRL